MSGHGGKKKRGGHEEEHENHERWLVSYADMMTLLMVLFIVMFAISSVDQKKFNELKVGLAGGFGAPITVADGGTAVLQNEVKPQGLISFGGAAAPADDPRVKEAVAAKGRRDAEAQRERVEAEVDKLEDAKAKIKAALAEDGLEDSVRFRYDERGLVVTVVDQVLFQANLAELTRPGNRLLDTIAPALRAIPNDLAVEGHTDSIKVKPKFFASDWELSSARAAGVADHLNAVDGIPRSRLEAVGHADQRPLIEGTTPEANNANRRVEIVIQPELTAADSALLESVAASDAQAD